MRVILRSRRTLVKAHPSRVVTFSHTLQHLWCESTLSSTILNRMALPDPHASPQRTLSSLWIGTQAWALRRLYSLHRTRHAAHLETGELGEREALFHLRQHGYTIVARRWKTARLRGDIDLIAWHDSTLCFIEVKTRSHRDAFPAELAVDEDKQRTLRRLARTYVHRLPAAAQRASTRFDVLSVYLAEHSASPDFVLNPGAFEWA